MFQAIEILLNFDKFQNQAPSEGTSGLLFPSYTEPGLRQFYDEYLDIYDKVTLSQDNIEYLQTINHGNYYIQPYYPSANRLFTAMALQNVMQPLLSGARLQAVLTESPRPPAERSYSPPYTAPTLTQDDFKELANRMLQRPIGTVWFVSMAYGYIHQGRYHVAAHGNLMMKYRDGIGLIQTNMPEETLDEYKNILRHRAINHPQLFSILTTQFPQPNKFYEVDFFEIGRTVQPMNFYDTSFSRQGCENTAQQGARGFGNGEPDDIPNRMNLCGNNGDRCASYLYHTPIFVLPPSVRQGLSQRDKRELLMH